MTTVGIIANPASGKDIRRLVAHGSTFDNNEKINIVRRVLLGLDALGVEHVYYMPDSYAIVPRAAAPVALRLQLSALPMPVLAIPSDSLEAAQRLEDLGVGCIVTLGGDGTNRIVAKGCGDVPLVPISTGTNNVFPQMVEATIAGLAAGLVATHAVPHAEVVHRRPRLDIWLNDELHDQALIDVVASTEQWIGARALWNPHQLSEIVLSRVSATEIGMCGLGGLLFPEACGTSEGVHIRVGEGGRSILAALAPGLIHEVPVTEAHLVAEHGRVRLQAHTTVLALDGERETELSAVESKVEIVLNPDGPRVVHIAEALREGARQGIFDLSVARSTDMTHNAPFQPPLN